MESGNSYSYWYLIPVRNLKFLMLIFFSFHKENCIKAFFLEYYLRLFRGGKKKKHNRKFGSLALIVVSLLNSDLLFLFNRFSYERARSE